MLDGRAMMLEKVSELEQGLKELVEEAWAIYQRAIENGVAVLVRPSMPILFFGDHERFFNSKVRIITVGLNPSKSEFPERDRFERFPEARYEDSNPPKAANYLRALANYFREQPYDTWFRPAFEELLQGMGASYYDGGINTALHTDICSPLATDPTWSRLGSESFSLEAHGIELWHRLVKRLEPDVVLISVARKHLDKIRFHHVGDWHEIHTIERANPFKVEALDLEITPGKRTMLVFGRAANLPFGTVSGRDKRTIGAKVLEAIRDK
jgi:hypothetical protein